MAIGQAFLRACLGILCLFGPGLFPACMIAGFDFPAHTGDLEDIAAALSRFGDQAEGLRAHTLGGKEKIEHVL